MNQADRSSFICQFVQSHACHSVAAHRGVLHSFVMQTEAKNSFVHCRAKYRAATQRHALSSKPKFHFSVFAAQLSLAEFCKGTPTKAKIHLSRCTASLSVVSHSIVAPTKPKISFLKFLALQRRVLQCRADHRCAYTSKAKILCPFFEAPQSIALPGACVAQLANLTRAKQ